jgi:hypothetical protein
MARSDLADGLATVRVILRAVYVLGPIAVWAHASCHLRGNRKVDVSGCRGAGFPGRDRAWPRDLVGSVAGRRRCLGWQAILPDALHIYRPSYGM